MSGYNNRLHMSNNAVEAYEMGTKPYDQWSAADIIDEVCRLYDPGKHDFDINKLIGIPIDALRMCTLSYSSWHHTTRKYKETDFYFVDNKKLLQLRNEDIDHYVEFVLNNDL